MKEEKISVIIPCFNEQRTIFKNAKIIYEYLSRNFSDFEIIAVNDGSRDDTLGELKKLETLVILRVIDNSKNEGKGKVVRDGFLASSKELAMFLDADLAIPIEELEKFIAEIKNGADIVIASRFIPGLRLLEPVIWYRKIMERIFRTIRMIIINNYDIKDTQCGFKVFKREVVEQLFPQLKINRFAFDSEIVFLARKMKFKIKELPITLQNPQKSSVRIYRDSLNMIEDLIRIRMNFSKGKYKI
jgi:glycosyltransferase involved in cell wall biosynthesis